ncbi:hypothetical protein, conserved [Cyanidioschyzon merolae strain 10D]|uniref:Uncharacterized protein n=1 Tax=Cyanidioschyzon merolae (strain NIES-3377 / 10D) TaxID=280699 RepID=M1VH86_CYAM1|nr:hypothetical protein, conserved [Cyanidioschyzon merolae strain 10D]BAM82667.1 hypothetical protein, conserved [Cyanidioschyzon merolae strain 10D]|eukprot:XP_005538703.1 hypothetical protein, conserved [Cyanidioschyzon merolae strain 10D]
MSLKHTGAQCGRTQGSEVGLLCARCDGQCVTCEAVHALFEPARICADCALLLVEQPQRRGETPRCCRCNAPGAKYQAMFCRECVLLLKSRNGCPRNVAVLENRSGSAHRRLQRPQATGGIQHSAARAGDL